MTFEEWWDRIGHCYENSHLKTACGHAWSEQQAAVDAYKAIYKGQEQHLRHQRKQISKLREELEELECDFDSYKSMYEGSC